MSDATSKSKHPGLGEIQRSLNRALEGYDCQCRMHYDDTVSINVTVREHDETFASVGIQPGELDSPTRLHLFVGSLRHDLVLLEPRLRKYTTQSKKSTPQDQSDVWRRMRGQRNPPSDQARRAISTDRCAR